VDLRDPRAPAGRAAPRGHVGDAPKKLTGAGQGQVDLNRATEEELQRLPGVGPATAARIVEYRKESGGFKSVDDLLAIKGIGPKKLEKMRKYLTVGKPPARKQSNAPETASAPAKSPPAKSPTKQPVSPPASEDEEP